MARTSVRRDVPTCAADAAAGLAVRQARAQGWDRCVVIAGQGTVIGILRAGRIGASEQAPAAEVMQPGPTTVRAHEDLDATRQRMGQRHVAAHRITAAAGGHGAERNPLDQTGPMHKSGTK